MKMNKKKIAKIIDCIKKIIKTLHDPLPKVVINNETIINYSTEVKLFDQSDKHFFDTIKKSRRLLTNKELHDLLAMKIKIVVSYLEKDIGKLEGLGISVKRCNVCQKTSYTTALTPWTDMCYNCYKKFRLRKEQREAHIRRLEQLKEAQIRRQKEEEARIRLEKAEKEAQIRREKDEKEAQLRLEKEQKEAQIRWEKQQKEAQIIWEKQQKEAQIRREQAEKEYQIQRELAKKEAIIKRERAEKEALIERERKKEQDRLFQERLRLEAIEEEREKQIFKQRQLMFRMETKAHVLEMAKKRQQEGLSTYS